MASALRQALGGLQWDLMTPLMKKFIWTRSFVWWLVKLFPSSAVTIPFFTDTTKRLSPDNPSEHSSSSQLMARNLDYLVDKDWRKYIIYSLLKITIGTRVYSQKWLIIFYRVTNNACFQQDARHLHVQEWFKNTIRLLQNELHKLRVGPQVGVQWVSLAQLGRRLESDGRERWSCVGRYSRYCRSSRVKIKILR